jgi:hypothetical protein
VSGSPGRRIWVPCSRPRPERNGLVSAYVGLLFKSVGWGGGPKALAEHDPRRFYWWVVLPFQSFLLTAFFGPFYGFSALIGPIDIDFGHTVVGERWSGAMAGSITMLFTALGAIYRERFLNWAGSARRLWGRAQRVVGALSDSLGATI